MKHVTIHPVVYSPVVKRAIASLPVVASSNRLSSLMVPRDLGKPGIGP